MSEKKKYQLRPGAHHFGRDPETGVFEYEAGATVELTDGQYAAWSDKFVPAGHEMEPPPHPTAPSLEPEVAEVQAAPQAAAAALGVTNAAKDLIAAAEVSTDAAWLQAMHDAESAKKKSRATVLEAIEDRMEELGG